jgi:uncharacterized protein YndB with AHSA1/START domain
VSAQQAGVTDPIELAFTVACTPAHAFGVWATRTAMWWPSSHTRSGDPATVVTFEPVEGGRIYERTPAGVQHDWGRILAWEPPGRLVYLWHLDATDPTDATEVTVTFTPADGGATLVTIVHEDWERLAADGRERRRRNLGGWAGLLSHYRRATVELAQ